MRTLLTIFLISALWSCSVVKKVNKDKSQTDTRAKVDSVGTSESKTETKITETIDTTVNIKGSEVSGSVKDTDLKEKPFVLEDENQIVTVIKDSDGRLKVTGKVKPKSIPVKSKKVTEIKSDSKQKVAVKSDKKSSVKTSSTDRDVKRTGIPWWIWLLGVIVLIVVAGVLSRSKA